MGFSQPLLGIIYGANITEKESIEHDQWPTWYSVQNTDPTHLGLHSEISNPISIFIQYERNVKSARHLALTYETDAPLKRICSFDINIWLFTILFKLYLCRKPIFHWHEQLQFFSRNFLKDFTTHSAHTSQ